MIKIILFIPIFITIIYLLSVLLVQTVNQSTTFEAKEKIKKFLKSCFASTPVPEVFPVFIGIDGNWYSHANIIEASFKDLKTVFSQVIFDHYYRSANRLIYYFKVGEPLVEMEQNQLIEYTTTICDSVVHDYLHQNAPAYGYIPYLVVTDYRPGELAVCISITPPGLNENYNLKIQQNKRVAICRNNSIPMSENWED